jgi:hypothetical protein
MIYDFDMPLNFGIQWVKGQIMTFQESRKTKNIKKGRTFFDF